MAQVGTGGSRGRRKNVDLNLVPFIDLMSVLITFLLIAAVWSQVSMIQIATSFYGKKSEEAHPPQPTPQLEIVLKVDVKKTGYILTFNKQIISLPKIKEIFDDEGLLAQLQRIKQIHPDKQDAVLAIADDMSYENLINAMDSILEAGFPAISVATGGPK